MPFVSVFSFCCDYDCVIAPERAAAERASPTRVNRERFRERFFRELARFATNFDCRVSADAKVRGLLNDTICVSALLLWRIDKIKSENQLLLIWQDDMKRIAVIPTLGLINAGVDSLKRLRRRCGPRERDHRDRDREQRCRRQNTSHSSEIGCLFKL